MASLGSSSIYHGQNYSDYRPEIQFCKTDLNNFGHYRLRMDQDIPYTYEDNFAHTNFAILLGIANFLNSLLYVFYS